MRDWLAIQDIYRECSHARVMRLLAGSALVSLSSVVLVLHLLVTVGALVALGALTDGWITAALAVPLVLFMALVGAVAIEDRIATVFRAYCRDEADRELLRRYRRGLLGARYILFRDGLRDAGRDSLEVIEAAINRWDAERALQNGRLRAPGGGIGLLLLIAAVLVLLAPLAAGAEYTTVALGTGIPLALLATVALAWRLAQPALPVHDDLRCMLVWGLEEIRAELPRALR